MDSAAVALADKDRRLFAGQLRRILDAISTRLSASAVSLSLSSGLDAACAICDAEGRSVAEAGSSPILAASIGAEVAAVVGDSKVSMGQGAIVALSDSQAGGLDTTTLTLVSPLSGGPGGDICGYLALRVRYSVAPFGTPSPNVDPPLPEGDELSALPPAVGPRYSGFQSAPPAPVPTPPTTVEDEGQSLSASLLTDALLRQLSRRSRAPRERLGDLLAQREALRYGLEHLRLLVERQGAEAFRQGLQAVLSHSEAAARAALEKLSDGFYAFADSLDDDGRGRTDIGIRATCILRRGQLQIDLRESEDAVLGPLNTSSSTVNAVVRHVFERFIPADVVRNDGLLAPLTVLVRPGSLLAAAPPAPLALGVDETAWRVADVLSGALAQAAPDKARAADCGTTSSLYLSWPGSGLLHRERLPGGSGGGPGTSRLALGIASSSVELLERQFPLRVLHHTVRRGSGGIGTSCGSDGESRELQLLGEVDVTLCGERRRRPPYGLAGGGPGTVGKDTLARDGKAPQPLPGKACFRGHAGDRICVESPGGGGHGDVQRAAFFAALLG